MKNKLISIKIIIAIVLLLLISLPTDRVKADEVSAVTIGAIDYENLNMQIFTGGNSVVYYSLDRSNWTEVEGEYLAAAKLFIMDISWISNTKDTTLYFKGNTVKTIKSVTLPEMNSSLKVTYNKANNSFTFIDVEDAEVFAWRKATDYNWTVVNMDEDSPSYMSFLADIEKLRIKGAKIIIRTPQVVGDGRGNIGMRPSKEITITIPAMENAPSVKVNSSKLTLNTSTSMEYFNTTTGQWVGCTSNMTIEELAPKALYKNGATDVTVMIRKAATSSKTYSKTAYVNVPGQAAAPSIGDISKDVTYYYMNKKLVLVFNNATTANKYEYAYAKPGTTFDASKASWKTVSSSKPINISSTTVPDGSIVYVRKKGIDASSSNNYTVVLSSAINNFVVKY